MELKVKDKETGIIYTNDMRNDNSNKILSMNFCKSYTEVEVQTEKRVHTLILPPLGNEPIWIDLIAVQKDNAGEWLIN